MNLDEILAATNYRINKSVSGQSFPSKNFNTMLQLVNLEYFKLSYGLPENYEKGSPFAKRSYEVSQRITDDLNPFLVSLDGRESGYLKVSSRGVAILPTDYAHVTEISYDTLEDVPKKIIIEIMTNAQWAARMNSTIIKPSIDNPICKFQKGQLLVFPYNISQIAFSYLRYPIKPFYATIEDTINEIEVYDPVNSIQLEFPEDTHSDFVNHLVAYAAENLTDQLRLQTAQNRKVQGI